MHCQANEQPQLERLCRTISRPTYRTSVSNERLKRDRAGNVVLQLKSPYREGTTHIVIALLEFMQPNCRKCAALVPRPLAGRVGPQARPLARHKQSPGMFVSGLGDFI